jgi:hypothetical protein
MKNGWVSPWNGNILSADEIIDEVALVAVSRLYIFSELGYTDYEMSIETDSIVVKSSAIDYSFVIYYPPELKETLEQYFPVCLSSIKREYGVGVAMDGLEKPSGEKMGEMLRNYNSLDRLIRLVYARDCWNQKRILAIHGIQSSKFLSKFENDLEQASILYWVMCPLGEEPGSCFFKTIGLEESSSILEDLNSGQAGVVERLFHLEREYGPHSLIANDGRLVSYGK